MLLGVAPALERRPRADGLRGGCVNTRARRLGATSRRWIVSVPPPSTREGGSRLGYSRRSSADAASAAASAARTWTSRSGDAAMASLSAARARRRWSAASARERALDAAGGARATPRASLMREDVSRRTEKTRTAARRRRPRAHRGSLLSAAESGRVRAQRLNQRRLPHARVAHEHELERRLPGRGHVEELGALR